MVLLSNNLEYVGFDCLNVIEVVVRVVVILFVRLEVGFGVFRVKVVCGVFIFFGFF